MLAFAAAASLLNVPIIETKIAYELDGVKMEGFLARPATKDLVPGVVIVHDWDGVNDYEIGRARQLAQEAGVAAFAADIYGLEDRPKAPSDNGKAAGKYRGNLPLFRARLKAAADTLAAKGSVIPGEMAVMGYCFGGGGALELARSGYPLKGAISFHGSLATTMPAKEGDIKEPVLLFHAAQDPAVPREAMNGFLDEMKMAKVDYQMVVFNVDTHAFTVPGSSYNEQADKRSWQGLKDFLKSIFQKG